MAQESRLLAPLGHWKVSLPASTDEGEFMVPTHWRTYSTTSDEVWKRPGWGTGHSLVQRAWGQCFTSIQRIDGLERCPPRKGNLSAPPLGRVGTASCFPAQTGREEPSSQLWAVPSDTACRAGLWLKVSSGSDSRRENGDFLGSERLLLSPLLLVPWESSGS